MNNRREVPGNKLTTTTMCERYKIARRTLARWIIDPNLGFPRSITINNRHYWNESDIVEWERSRASSNLKAA